jgi:carboxylesterase
MDNTNRKILPGAGPFNYEGNDIGILLLHGGGGGTAADLKPIAEFLHKEGGYTVRVPLLTGFGTTPEELKDTEISAWLDDLELEYNFIKEKCKKVIVGGHSMGGVFTLYLGATKKPDGIFTIAAPTGIRHRIKKALSIIPKSVKHGFKYFSLSWKQFEIETNGEWVGYKKLPLSAGMKLLKIIGDFKKYHSEITCPALLIQGRFDSEVKPESMDEIYDAIKSEKKKKLWLKNSDHPILRNPDEELLFNEILSFIQEINKSY